MKINQIIKNNVGIDDLELPGYQHGDGLTKEGHPAHEAIRHDMRAFADDLVKMYPNARKFLDVGSGAGYLTQRIRELGGDYVGVNLDGNKETLGLPSVDSKYHFIVRTDKEWILTDEEGDIIEFDVITSFEHFEHIHPDNFPQFISNIKKHMGKDSVLYASAAKWNYSTNDRVHINVKPETLWKLEMENYGFVEINTKLFNETNTAGCRLRWNETAELAYKLK